MPEALARNCRLVTPCFLASSPPSSLMRASSRRCFAVWGAGMNSSLETLWVGTGPGNAAVSAGASALSSASVSSLMAVSLLPSGGGGVSADVAHLRGPSCQWGASGPTLRRRTVGCQSRQPLRRSGAHSR